MHPIPSCISSLLSPIGNPFDVIKIRLQTQSSLYHGPLDCFHKIFVEEGLLAFWKGVTPALGSAFIENSVLFTANGILKRQYLQSRESENEDLSSLEVAILGGLSGICSATVWSFSLRSLDFFLDSASPQLRLLNVVFKSYTTVKSIPHLSSFPLTLFPFSFQL